MGIRLEVMRILFVGTGIGTGNGTGTGSIIY
jgi:hypothetical protein